MLEVGLLAPAGTALSERVEARLPDVLVLGRDRWTVDDFSQRPGAARPRDGGGARFAHQGREHRPPGARHPLTTV